MPQNVDSSGKDNPAGIAPDISAIIVSYNNRSMLTDLLNSLRGDSSGKVLEIIVIDNNSGDGTVPMVRDAYPEVRLIESRENLGLTKGVNKGLSLARGQHIVLLDSDTVLDADVLGVCSDYLAAHPEVGVVAPRLEYPDGRLQATARRFPRPINAFFGRHTFLSRLFPSSRFTRSYLRAEDLHRTEPYEVDWVSAACMMFPRRLAEELGGLDEQYWTYWVDADWCRRVRNLGFSVHALPGVRVIHAEQYQPWKRKAGRASSDFTEAPTASTGNTASALRCTRWLSWRFSP